MLSLLRHPTLRRLGVVATATTTTAAAATATTTTTTTTTTTPTSRRHISSQPNNVLLVQAHPISSSFSSACASTVQEALEARGAQVRRRNLCAMPDGQAFSPLLSDAERAAYFDEGRQPQLEGDPHVKDLVAALRWCDALVLVYPTWWFNTPAHLKGFFDRCFVPGVGFRYDHALQKRTVGLTNIERLGVVTSYGFDEQTVIKAGDAGRTMIHGGMTMLMHPEVVKTWDALYSMQAAQTREDRERFLKALRERYTGW
jgi:NAD(P)H dehydrogenase (quinone)